MKNRFPFFDGDTHVNPAAEVLERDVDPDFRPRLAELAQSQLPASHEADGPDSLHNYRVDTKFYRRILGQVAPRESLWALGIPGYLTSWRITLTWKQMISAKR